MFGEILPRSFYCRDTVAVARDLLGKILVHRTSAGMIAGIITEVEAYLGEGDLAAHSAAGITERTRVIFGAPGYAYVYLSYGVHECLNVVAEAEGKAGCVLIRALRPVAGMDLMRKRRPAAKADDDLASGPGKLTRALGITRLHYGADLTGSELTIRTPAHSEGFTIEVTRRIGITKSTELPLRFVARGVR